MNTRGRPILYRPEFCARAREIGRLGASNDQLAAVFGVAPRSIDNWIARIPEFAAAVDEGRAVVRGEMARKLYQRAVGYEETVERVVRLRGGATTTVTYTRHHLPETRACARYLYLRLPRDWRRRPDLPPDARQNLIPPAAQEFGDWQPSDSDDVEVGYALHQRGTGCRQTVERVVVWWGEPKVITYVRRHPPQYQAGVVWLTNRLPEQWKPLAALRTADAAAASPPTAHQLTAGHSTRDEDSCVAEVGAAPRAAAGALNQSDLANSGRAGSATAGSAIIPAGPKASVGLFAVRHDPVAALACRSSWAGFIEASSAGGPGEIRAQEHSKRLPVFSEMPIFRSRRPCVRGPPIIGSAASRRSPGRLAWQRPKGRESVFTST